MQISSKCLVYIATLVYTGQTILTIIQTEHHKRLSWVFVYWLWFFEKEEGPMNPSEGR